MFKDFKSLWTELKKVGKPEMNFDQFITLRDYCINNVEAVKGLLSSFKVAELKTMVYTHYETKKDQIIDKIYDTVLNYFNLTGSVQYSPMTGETYADALKKVINNTTEEQYVKYCAAKAKEHAELQKALDNPETMEEFRTFMRYRGESQFTPEQRIKWDELNADRSKEVKKIQAEREAVVQAVKNIEGVEMELKHSRHTKKGIPLFVVVLSTRVERDKYTELNTKAKKLGGYYSSYVKDGAIAGFTFEDEEAAKAFMDLKNGNVDSSEIKAEKAEIKTENRAERLIAKALEIEGVANEELNRDRKTNTHKRATEAAHAEKAAMGRITFAKTLRSIAEGIKEDKIKYLDRLSTLTELESLQRLLSMAKWRYIREKNIREENFEMCSEVIDSVVYPNPTLYKENAINVLNKVREDKGKKLAANRMLKRLRSTKEENYIVSGESCLEDFKTCFCSVSKGISAYEILRYQDDLKILSRFKRLGLDTIHEVRAALRELMYIMKDSKISPEDKAKHELKELERKFIGSKIAGFFPTPSDLAEFVVELADIKEGDKVLEPSGGLGHIADEIRKAHPDNSLKVVEYNSALAEVLSKKGFTVEQKDFLVYVNGGYDKIVMNPPFEDMQDIDHVKHAFSMLNKGGRLVAIMAGNKTGTRSKIVEFNKFVENNGGEIIQNENGAFKDAFRSTGVSTITLILDK